MKGLSYIVATILMLMIVIALAGTAWLYISGIFHMATEDRPLCVEIISTVGSVVRIRNCERSKIHESKLMVEIDGERVRFVLNPKTIDPFKTGEIRFYKGYFEEGEHTLTIRIMGMPYATRYWTYKPIYWGTEFYTQAIAGKVYIASIEGADGEIESLDDSSHNTEFLVGAKSGTRISGFNDMERLHIIANKEIVVFVGKEPDISETGKGPGWDGYDFIPPYDESSTQFIAYTPCYNATGGPHCFLAISASEGANVLVGDLDEDGDSDDSYSLSIDPGNIWIKGYFDNDFVYIKSNRPVSVAAGQVDNSNLAFATSTTGFYKGDNFLIPVPYAVRILALEDSNITIENLNTGCKIVENYHLDANTESDVIATYCSSGCTCGGDPGWTLQSIKIDSTGEIIVMTLDSCCGATRICHDGGYLPAINGKLIGKEFLTFNISPSGGVGCELPRNYSIQALEGGTVLSVQGCSLTLSQTDLNTGEVATITDTEICRITSNKPIVILYTRDTEFLTYVPAIY